MYFLNAKDKFTLTSSTAFVEDYPAWDSNTTYNTGDVIIYNNRIYKSLIDSNNEEPGTGLNWFDEGATNPYKCIDEYVNTQTANSDNLEMWFDVKTSNAIALINIECLSVLVELYDSTGEVLVWSANINTVAGTSNWEEYFFNEIEFTNKLFIDFPFIFIGKLKVIVYGVDVKVGVLQIGLIKDLGITLQDVTATIDDYSNKDVDENGNIYLKEGNFRDSTECTVLLNNSAFNDVKRRLAEIRATPCVYVASDNDIYRELNLFGFYESFEINIQDANKSECKLILKGLI